MRWPLSLALLAGCNAVIGVHEFARDAAAGDGSDGPTGPDADPSALALVAVSPATIYEGQGDGGSRPALIVVEGSQLLPGARLTLVDHTAGTPYLGATVDDANTVVSSDGRWLAAPVRFVVDTQLRSTVSVRLDVTVTQSAGGTMISRTLTAADASDTPVLEELGLDELVPVIGSAIPSGTHLVSSANLAGGLLPADTNQPIVIRATASVTITGTIDMSANGQARGPGGHDGGNGGAGTISGTSLGSPGAGQGAGQPNGGGGGFSMAGLPGSGTGGLPAGEPALLTISVPSTADASSGGAGGAGGPISVKGGAGGGGGGTIEISAGGDLTLGFLAAKGGTGGSSNSGAGGGGSGGAVLLRTGGVLAISAIDAGGGLGGGPSGGNGSGGRVRIDAPVATLVGFNGPQLVAPPLITRSAVSMITVRGQPSTAFGYYATSAGTPSQVVFVSTAGDGLASVALPLEPGLDGLCVMPLGATLASPDEARNCVAIAYLP